MSNDQKMSRVGEVWVLAQQSFSETKKRVPNPSNKYKNQNSCHFYQHTILNHFSIQEKKSH